MIPLLTLVGGGGGSMSPVWNLKSLVAGFYKCLSLIVGFVITVAIWPREVVSCGDFILRAVAIFWAMSLVGIYPGRASIYKLDQGFEFETMVNKPS